MIPRALMLEQPRAAPRLHEHKGAVLPVLAISVAGISGLALLYVLLFLFLGIRSIRRGHWIMFLVGIPLPIFWVIGGLMPPVER